MRIRIVLLLVLNAFMSFSGQAQPNLQVSPSSVDFGYRVNTETSDLSRQIVLKNSGTSDLQFTSGGIVLRGPDAGEFQITSMPSLSVMPKNNSRSVFVAFDPQSLGEKYAEVLVYTSDPNSAVTTIPLIGRSVMPRTSVVQGAFNGYGPGRSTIGAGGDYDSLYAATKAISEWPLTGGDWDFVILNDLNEPHHSRIQQPDDYGHTITFRPAPDTSPRVTFTTSVQTINTAHIMLKGTTTRVVFDGRQSLESTTPSLTFANLSRGGAASIIQSDLFWNNITLSHCRFEQNSYDYTSPLPAPYRTSKILDIEANVAYPVSISVKDCDFVSTEPIQCTAISLGAYRPSAQAPDSQKLDISKNRIVSHGTGVVAYNFTSAQLEDNHIVLNRSIIGGFAVSQYGIRHVRSHQEDDVTSTNISGNRIHFIGDSGSNVLHIGILLDERGRNALTYVTNNIITGRPGGVPDDYFDHVGIHAAQSAETTAILAHNSIALGYDSKPTGSYYPQITAGLQLSQATYKTGMIHLYNNIIRMGSLGGYAVYSPNPTMYLSSNYNNIYTSGTSRVGRIGYEEIPTLTDWQTSTSQDMASVSYDPYVPADIGLGTWVGPEEGSSPDLHFSSFPGEQYLVTPLREDGGRLVVPSDIDGTVRSTAGTVMGADEMQLNAGVSYWGSY